MGNGYDEKADVKSDDLTIVLQCDSTAIEAALASLTEIAKVSPQIVQRFLDGLDSTSQLVSVDSDTVLAAGTGKCWIKLQPSDLLVEFLAASRTRECNEVRI